MKKSDFYQAKSTFPTETIGKDPSWILKSGISILSLIITLLFLASIFIRYPDKISSPISITSIDPPIRITNQVNGVLDSLYVKDNQMVEKGQLLYYINDGYTNLKDIERLKFLLNKSINESFSFSFKNEDFLLGGIQSSFQDFDIFLIDYREYCEYNPNLQLISKNQTSIKEYLELNKIIKRKIEIQKRKIEIKKDQYSRMSKLKKGGLISEKEEELENLEFLNNNEDLENLHIEQSNINLKITDLRKENTDLLIKNKNTIKSFIEELQNKAQSLKNSINIWEQTHLVRAPKRGIVTFLKHDLLNLHIVPQSIFLAILSTTKKTKSDIKGKMYASIYNSGKIKLGQKVNIYLENYIYQDYGIVEGLVQSISKIPENNSYLIDVKLPNGLKTNQKTIQFNEELKGKAEIILDNKTLFERFFERIFYRKQ